MGEITRTYPAGTGSENHLDPVVDTVALTALPEASLKNFNEVTVQSEFKDYYYDIDAVAGDFAPDDQTGGTGFWVEQKSTGIMPMAHALGGAEHTASTLAELNIKVSDATLDDSGDPRTPLAHTHNASDINAGTLTDARIAESNVTQHEAAIDHDALTNFAIGEHRVISDASTSTTELLSASQIDSRIGASAESRQFKGGVLTCSLGLGNITLSGEQTLNGETTLVSDVLLTEQTAGAENGPWVTAAGAWSRPANFNEAGEANNGDTWVVTGPSSTTKGLQWTLITEGTIVIDTTVLDFVNDNVFAFGDGAGQAVEGTNTRVPTQDENDALVGTNGTPSTANKYVTSSDPSNTDTRDPNAHASEHTDGTDDIQNATAAQKGLATAAQITKLDAITGTNTGDEAAASTTVSGISELATTAEVDTGTDATRAITPSALNGSSPAFENVTVNGQANSPFFALSAAAASIPVDGNNGNNQKVTLGANGPYTLANPTNLKDGATYSFLVTQDGTGGRTLAYGTNYHFGGGSAPVLSTGIGAVDLISGISDGTVIHMGIRKDSKTT